MSSNSAAVLALSGDFLESMRVARSCSASSAPCPLPRSQEATLPGFSLVAGSRVLYAAQQAYFSWSALLREPLTPKESASHSPKQFLQVLVLGIFVASRCSHITFPSISFGLSLCVSVWRRLIRHFRQ